MLEFVKFTLAVFGTTASIGIAVRRTRLSVKPLNCALCMGLWVGILYAWLMGLSPWWVWGPVGAGSSWILNRYVTGES